MVRNGTSFSIQERPKGITAITIPHRKTPCSECAKALRNASWIVGGEVLHLLGREMNAADELLRDVGRELANLVGEAGAEDGAEDRDAERAAD